MDRRWKHQTMWKKMAAKGHIMNDPISWHPEQANSQNQKIYQCLPKAGERLIMGTLGWCSEIGNGNGCILCEVTLVQYKPTELHNWKWVDFMVYTGFCLNEAVLKQQQKKQTKNPTKQQALKVEVLPQNHTETSTQGGKIWLGNYVTSCKIPVHCSRVQTVIRYK